MIIRLTSKFRKAYKKMPKMVKLKSEEREKIFKDNPYYKGIFSAA